MPAPSPAIANEFIRRAAADGLRLTQMQLQKLVYISHGWNLAIHNRPLTEDAPAAWDYGPVYRDLYDALRRYGRQEVDRTVRRNEYGGGEFWDGPGGDEEIRADLIPEERAVVDRVYRDYGRYHAFQLSALTHQPDTPWSRVYAAGVGRYHDIPNDLIREHFVGVANGARRAAL